MYCITLAKGKKQVLLWVRRTRVSLKKPTMAWAVNLCTPQDIDDVYSYRHLFPKRTTAQWYLRSWISKSGQHKVRITRIPTTPEEGDVAMPFDEALQLFLSHSRMLITKDLQ